MARPSYSDEPKGVRIRGRKAVKLRQERLAREPLCRHCKEQGRITVATVPDHIIALANGGKDEDSNIQCLCHPCHERKTAKDLGYRQKQAIGPDGWPV